MQNKEKNLRKRRLQNKEKREKFEEKKSILQGKKNILGIHLSILLLHQNFFSGVNWCMFCFLCFFSKVGVGVCR